MPVALEQVELPRLDLQGADWARDPWATARRLREDDARGGRLARSERGIEVLFHEAYATLIGDRRLETLHTDHYAQAGAGPVALDFVDNGHLLTFDTERHLRVRRVMTAAFRLSHIEERREWFGELADELIDGFAGEGRCDLVADFSHRYSIEILCRMIGVPAEDIPRFEQATLEMALMNALPLEPVAARLEAALQTIWDYCTEIVQRRRAEPREDFISGMIEAERTEGKLTERETIWGVANLLFAGHDTTRYQIAAAVRTIAGTPDWEALAADPGLAPAALEEILRLFPVVQVTSRVVVGDDVVVDGVHMPPGTVLRFNWFAFNRDPERFAEPDRFALRREDRDGLMPFGAGVHKCIGHALARADLEEALVALTGRLTDVRVAGDVPQQPFTGALGGPTALPIEFAARA
ncbi:MAG: bioI 1 [Solirubrobacterales bacterium]|nr:bioI 1 [Solirubrobacterales bacterium]